MSNISTEIEDTLKQGASYTLDLKRHWYPNDVQMVGCTLIDKTSGLPVNKNKLVEDNLDDASALVIFRKDNVDGEIMFISKTSNYIGTLPSDKIKGEVIIENNGISVELSASDTDSFEADQLYGQIDVHYSNGNVENFYIVKIKVIKNGNNPND